MSTKHTQGPWYRAVTSLEQIQIVTVDPKTDEPNGLVAVVNRVAWCNEGEDQANARLIASAPELLSALESFLDDNADFDECRAKAIAAIAKATRAPWQLGAPF